MANLILSIFIFFENVYIKNRVISITHTIQKEKITYFVNKYISQQMPYFIGRIGSDKHIKNFGNMQIVLRYIIHSLIMAESAYNIKAKSNKYARGLMQVVDVDDEDYFLFTPGINIKKGLEIFFGFLKNSVDQIKYLKKEDQEKVEFQHLVMQALLQYNGGNSYGSYTTLRKLVNGVLPNSKTGESTKFLVRVLTRHKRLNLIPTYWIHTKNVSENQKDKIFNLLPFNVTYISSLQFSKIWHMRIM